MDLDLPEVGRVPVSVVILWEAGYVGRLQADGQDLRRNDGSTVNIMD